MFQTHKISNRKYLDKVCGDDGELRLGARQPDGLDDEVPGGQLGVEDQVVRHGAGAAERKHVAVLGRAEGIQRITGSVDSVGSKCKGTEVEYDCKVVYC